MRAVLTSTCVAALGLLLGGCGQVSQPTQPGEPRVGQQAPDIDGEDLNGQHFKLSDYRGKVVVVDFWQYA